MRSCRRIHDASKRHSRRSDLQSSDRAVARFEGRPLNREIGNGLDESFCSFVLSSITEMFRRWAGVSTFDSFNARQ